MSEQGHVSTREHVKLGGQESPYDVRADPADKLVSIRQHWSPDEVWDVVLTYDAMDRLAGWWLGQTTVLQEEPADPFPQLKGEILAFASEMEKRLRVYDRSEWPVPLTAGVLHEELLERVKVLGYTLMIGSDDTMSAAVDVANVARLMAEVRRATEDGG